MTLYEALALEIAQLTADLRVLMDEDEHRMWREWNERHSPDGGSGPGTALARRERPSV